MDWDLEEAAAYYRRQGAPADQSAVVSFLREAQQHSGGSIPGHLLAPMAQALGTREAMLNALIRRIPSLRLSGGHLLELCSGPNCGKAAHLASLAERLCVGREDVTLRFVPCMRMCGKDPNLRWDGKLYHGAEENLIRTLLK